MTPSPAHSLWLPLPQPPRPHATLRLFCIPYAGGGPPAFRGWSGLLSESIDVRPVQLPGRGARLREKPFTRLEPLVEALASALQPWLDRPFAIYGHSLGGLLGYELARTLRGSGVQPEHLFVSGVLAPHRPDPNPKIHELPDAIFLKELKLLNGTPREVMDCVELMELLLPALRADFTVLETYQHALQAPLEFPITVFGGHDDPRARPSDLEAWRELTRAECRTVVLPGDHFFIGPQQRIMLAMIADRLSQRLVELSGKPSPLNGKVHA